MFTFPNFDVDAIKQGLHIGNRAAVSFGVQALRLLSEIRDNTSSDESELRMFNGMTPAADGTNYPNPIINVPAGESWELVQFTSFTTTGAAVNRIVRVNGAIISIINSGNTAALLTTCSVPLPANSVVTLGAGGTGAILEYTFVVKVNKVRNHNDKMSAHNVDYTSVDNVGISSSIHLDGHPVN